jgi:hypothetical protein
VRTVGVEASEGFFAIDKVLRQGAGGHRFAYATFFATDEIERAHTCFL